MNKSLINISDISSKDLKTIMMFVDKISPYKDNSLLNKNIGLIFEKNSTRTRLSFQCGIRQLNGNYIDINLKDLNLERIESLEDTFEIMSCYLDGIVFRTTNHDKLEIAKKFFKKPVINALSNLSHPCQAISDIYTLKEHFQREDGFKINWMGDMNNVLFSLVECVNLLNESTINVFTNKNIYKKNIDMFPKSSKVSYHFEIHDDLFRATDCVMTDVYNSMNDKQDKETELVNFQVNSSLMNITPKFAVFMHCLPAKIGSEVTNNVIKGPKSIVLQQAKNRMIAQRGIMKWLEF